MTDWTPNSWRAFPAEQQPTYSDGAALERVAKELAALPPLVTSWEVEGLKRQLALAAKGEAFLLQGGDCAESFEDCTSPVIADKLKILRCLDGFRVDYVEGGWPGSNPKDFEFFRAARAEKLEHARLASFGSTTRPGKPAEEDSNLRSLIEVETPVVTIFGKSWRLHVTEIFRTTLPENLRMIEDSVKYLRQGVDQTL